MINHTGRWRIKSLSLTEVLPVSPITLGKNLITMFLDLSADPCVTEDQQGNKDLEGTKRRRKEELCLKQKLPVWMYVVNNVLIS